jgi:hypothetical protein
LSETPDNDENDDDTKPIQKDTEYSFHGGVVIVAFSDANRFVFSIIR